MTTEPQVRSDAKTRKFTRTALQMIVGGAFGFFIVLGVDRLVSVENMSAAGIVALGLAFFSGLAGLTCLAATANRRVFTAVQPETEDDDGADFEQMRSMFFWSVISLFFYAAILVLITLAGINGDDPQLMSFWSICALMLAQTGISAILWTKYDELYREIMKDSCAVTFVIVEFGLIIWAAAAICGLEVTFDPLTVIVAVMGVNLASLFWVGLRRGLN